MRWTTFKWRDMQDRDEWRSGIMEERSTCGSVGTRVLINTMMMQNIRTRHVIFAMPHTTCNVGLNCISASNSPQLFRFCAINGQHCSAWPVVNGRYAFSAE
jgi:hypothetical protein